MTSSQEKPPRNTTVSIKAVLTNPGNVLNSDFMHCGQADGLAFWPAWQIVCCGGPDLWYSQHAWGLEQNVSCRCGRDLFISVFEGVIDFEHR